MAKKAKKIQTDYTKGGHEISQTAIPLYQNNLNRIEEWQADKGIGAAKDYYNTLYANSTEWNDQLRDYQRAMGKVTANNYSATSGGYSSTGQRNYDDQQRYYNDAMARLYDQGIQTALSQSNNYYDRLLNGTTAYSNAYALGKDYSDIEQYNNAVSKSNNNWIGNLMTSTGSALMQSNNGLLQGIGAAMGTAGNMIQYDTSDITGAQGSGSGGTTGGQYTNYGTALGQGLRTIANTKNADGSWKHPYLHNTYGG